MISSREASAQPAPAKSRMTPSSDWYSAWWTFIHSGTTCNHHASGLLSEKFACTNTLPSWFTTRRNSRAAPSRSTTWCQTKNSRAASHEESGNGMCSADPAAYVTPGCSAWLNGLSTHLVCRLDAVHGAAEGARQGRRHSPDTRAQVEPGQWPCLGQVACERHHPCLQRIGRHVPAGAVDGVLALVVVDLSHATSKPGPTNQCKTSPGKCARPGGNVLGQSAVWLISTLRHLSDGWRETQATTAGHGGLAVVPVRPQAERTSQRHHWRIRQERELDREFRKLQADVEVLKSDGRAEDAEHMSGQV